MLAYTRNTERIRFGRFIGRWEALVFLIYAGVASFMTYPAITLTGSIHAENPSDALGVMWSLWMSKYAYMNHLLPSMNMIAVPFGQGGNSNGFGADPLTGITLRFMSIATNETITYNLFMLFSFFLNAVCMYYLVRYLTGSRAAGFFSGLAFGFCPYLLHRGECHLGLMAAMWIPLFVLSLVWAWRRKTAGSFMLCGVVFIVLTLFNFQYSFLTGFFTIFFLPTLWLSGKPWRKRDRDFKRNAGALFIVLLFLAVLITLFVLFLNTSRGKQNFSADLAGLSGLSARPWDYFIPHPRSAFLGNFTKQLRFGRAYGGGPRDVFLGYIPLALAAYALALQLRPSKRSERDIRVDEIGEVDGENAASKPSGGRAGRATLPVPLSAVESRRVIWSLLAAGSFAFAFSLPPTVNAFGVRLYGPSILFTRLFPMFRVYDRLGMIVMLCVAVLAGFGLSHLLDRIGTTRTRVILTAALSVLVLLEFTIVPPFNSIDTRSTTDYYRWLKKQKGDTVAVIYPVYHIELSYNYLFQQRIHEKRLVNGAGTTFDRAERYRQIMLDLWHPSTPGILAGLGTDYVMIIPDDLEKGGVINYAAPAKVDLSDLPNGLAPVKAFGECRIFKVTATPAEFVPLFTFNGVYETYRDRNNEYWHPCLNEASVDLISRSEDTSRCDISFTVKNLQGEGVLDVKVNDKLKSSTRISTRPKEITIQDVALKPGNNTVELISTGQLGSIANTDTEVTYYSDNLASILVSNMIVERSP